MRYVIMFPTKYSHVILVGLRMNGMRAVVRNYKYANALTAAKDILTISEKDKVYRNSKTVMIPFMLYIQI